MSTNPASGGLPNPTNVSLRTPDNGENAQLASRATLKPRRPLRRSPIPMPLERHLLITAKFRDTLLARHDGTLAISLLEHADSTSFATLAATHGLQFKPQIPLDDDVIERVETIAAQTSGSAQPDLRGMFFIGAPQAVTIEDAHAITAALNARPAIEHANVRSLLNTAPPPEDIAPPTDDFRPNQSWRGLGSETGEASIDNAWSYLGRGQGNRTFDVEQAYNPAHEDLVDIGIENFSTGNFDTTNSNVDHGTKTFGVLAAPDNGYGVAGAAPHASRIGFASNFTDDASTGIVITCPDPDNPAQNQTFSPYTGRAMVSAIDELVTGSVLLLEVQNDIGVDAFAPAEVEEAVFCLTKLAIDSNIIVGAGTPDTDHYRLEFSSYGSRVDVQAWGLNVVTSAAPGGPGDDQGYAGFNGTSSASAVVAGTCMAVQSARQARSLSPLRINSIQMRTLLTDTGNPQNAGGIYPGSIGPAVDAQRAIDSFIPEIVPDPIEDGSLPITYDFNSASDLGDLKAWDPVRSTEAGVAEIKNGALLLRNA